MKPTSPRKAQAPGSDQAPGSAPCSAMDALLASALSVETTRTRCSRCGQIEAVLPLEDDDVRLGGASAGTDKDYLCSDCQW